MRDHDKGKKPTQLYGEGFDDEARKITYLTRYLDFETWTPIEAAMLVCGLAPHDDCQQIPENGAFSLDGVAMMGNSDPFYDARWILKGSGRNLLIK